VNCRRADMDKFFKVQPTYLYDNCSLCANHFEDFQFVDPVLKNRLKATAIPTIFNVPNPPQRVDSKRPARRKLCLDNALQASAASLTVSDSDMKESDALITSQGLPDNTGMC
jgi:hypothetical protein